MAGRFHDRELEAHIEAISSRTEPESARLVAATLRRCWPGGAADRSEPAALEWVRRWRPRRVGILPLTCSCKAGRCGVCN